MPEITLEGVTLNVRDLEAAKAFYSRLPGAKLRREEESLASYDFGGARVSLRQSSEEGFHLEFATGDVQAAKRVVEAAGAKVENGQESKFFLRDPDGHELEIERGSGEHAHQGVLLNPERDEENAGLG